LHRIDYEICPFKIDSVPVGAYSDAASLKEANEPYTVEAQKRRPKKRSDDYYWQLYFDYRDKAQQDPDGDEPDTSAAEPAAPKAARNGTSEEPPHPADMPEHVAGHLSGNGNGNGIHNGNGHSPLSNGAGHTPHNTSTKVDLAVSDGPTVMLFADAEPAAPSQEEAGPAKVSAGNYNEFEYELIQDQSRLAQVAELLATEKVLGIDTETTGLDPYNVDLLLLQISTADKVYIVDCKRVVPLALKGVLENPDILKLAQNAKFEYVMLRQQVGITLNGIFDTMLAERLLTAGISREISLKAISQKYIGAVLDKSVRESFYKLAAVGDAYLAQEQLHYAARDAFIMIPIWKQMLPGLKKQGLLPVADLEFKCIPAVGDMELAGVQIDVTRWRNIIAGVAVQREKAAEELTELLAPASMQATMFGVSSINLNSNVQLLEAFNHLGVIMPDTMESTLVKYDHPVVAKLLEYRSHEKTLSAFGENVLGLINPLTGRIHPDFNQYGADTGRFSCTKPNVQQIPATSDFRKCFIAAPGYKLVTCDYSQCVSADTWVSTRNGWVWIQDHPDAISKGTSSTVMLTTDRRYRVECTPDHRVLTDKGWRPAQDLHAGDWVALQGQSAEKPEAFDARSWLMGFWVGDGSLNSSPGSLYFAKGVETGVEELAGYIEETLGEKPRETTYSLYVTNQRKTADLYRSLFNKKDLRLPLDRMENITSFLSGLFDADGTSNRFGVSLSTRFQGLAQDVQLALLPYGIVSTIVSGIAGRNMVPGGKLRYEVRVSDSISLANFDRFIGFRLSAKRAAFQAYTLREKRDQGNILPVPVAVMRALGVDRVEYIKNHEQDRPYTRHKLAGLALPELDEYTRYHWDRVESVVESGRSVEVFDLMDQPEERFVAAGIVVHNCELRVLAELSGDPAFVEAFQSGQDLHTLTAAQMFGVAVADVAKPQRSAAKAINFGLAYGMGPGGLAPRLGVSLDEAKALISRYFAAYPGIQKWLDKAAKDSVRLGYSVTPLGRKRFYNLPDESLKRSSEDDWRKQIAAIERQGKNSPIQGCNADMTKLALINLRAALSGWDARTVNTVHDEIVVEAREDQAEEVKHLVEAAMLDAGKAILKEVPIVADAAVADYWSK
jgi:DNA polymerase I-like protein with 3'-5' exonuclease and polymerase domains/intein/homing endonuclease